MLSKKYWTQNHEYFDKKEKNTHLRVFERKKDEYLDEN